MIKIKRRAAVCALVLAAGILGGCAGGGPADTSSEPDMASSDDWRQIQSPADHVGQEDLDASWSEREADALISLEGDKASVKGKGAAADDEGVTITRGGTYIVSGTLDQGRIAVDAKEDDLVRLVLNGADITSHSAPPIYCTNADKLVVVLAEETQNFLTDARGNDQPSQNGASSSQTEPSGGPEDAQSLPPGESSLKETASDTGEAPAEDSQAQKTVRLLSAGTDSPEEKGASSGGRAQEPAPEVALPDVENGLPGDAAAEPAGEEGEKDDETQPSLYGAALYAACDLSINGQGNLVITAGYKNGVTTKDDLIVVSGQLEISAANHGIRGKDSVTLVQPDLKITAGKDGIQSDNAKKEDKGKVQVYGGVINITAGRDGIQAETDLLVEDGKIKLHTGGGHENAPERTEERMGMPGGGRGFPDDMEFPEEMAFPEGLPMPDGGEWPQGGFPGGPDTEGEPPPEPPGDGAELPERQPQDDPMSSEREEPPYGDEIPDGEANTSPDAAGAQDSAKGLKAGRNLTVNGGSIVIDSADDGLHSNDEVLINNGSITINTGDDGVHADQNLWIEGGELLIEQSYEGIEAALVTIRGGEVNITASDDGINAAVSGGETAPGSVQEAALNIEGGRITITAGGDGLDSNGDIHISGGETMIYMTNGSRSSGGDGPVDRDGVLRITGGVLMGSGGAGDASVGTREVGDYTQGLLEIHFSEAVNPGETYSLVDESGNEILGFRPRQAFTTLIFTAPQLVENSRVALLDSQKETLVETTVQGFSNRISETGEPVTDDTPGFGGGMNGGRGPGRM